MTGDSRQDNRLFIFGSDRLLQLGHFSSIFSSISNLIGFREILHCPTDRYWSGRTISSLSFHWYQLSHINQVTTSNQNTPNYFLLLKYFLKFILKYFSNSESSILHDDQSHKVSSNILNGTDTISSEVQQIIWRHFFLPTLTGRASDRREKILTFSR